jgi:[ribosomal protein S5]-alanine N-acetyltransferase
MFTTERLVLRLFKAKDYQAYFEYMSLEETYRFERGEPITIKEAKKFCKAQSKDNKFWAATLKENGKLIGHVSFTPDRPQNFQMWNLGYIFNPAYQHKGYASEAARGVIRYAFTVMHVHRIVGHCSPDNIASWKVLEKCGMKKEGLSRKDFPIRLDENGNTVWLDSYDYAILDEDFQQQNNFQR